MHAPVIAKLSQALKSMTADPDFREKALQQSAEVVFSISTAFARLVNDGRSRFGKFIRDTGIKLD